MNETADRHKGPLAWMVHNRVTANLLMLVLLCGGLLMATQIKKEVFPEFSQDTVTVSLPFPGASPEEVEQGVILVVEEAVRGIEGVHTIQATASEGSGRVVIELLSGADHQKVYQEIQQSIDRIRTFPEDAEKPTVSLSSHRRDVMDLKIYGDVAPGVLRAAAEYVRDALLQDPDVTQAELEGVSDYEIHIEIPAAVLRGYGLTLNQVADTLAAASLDRSGGSVKTQGGEILLRVQERKEQAREFANTPLIEQDNGALVRLGDIAQIKEGFADTNTFATYNGQPAVGIEVFRTGDQTPVSVATAVRRLLPQAMASLPPSVHIAIEDDDSEIYQARLTLLLKNGFIGLLLVLALLSLLLEFKLAFWVTVGIPTAILGSFLFLPLMDVSVNMISMFAFIIALGIVVDDAVIAGENIYEYRNRGMNFIDAAIQGARDIAVPISFSIITNIVAFLPLAFVPGTFGKIWGVIPAVVSTVFIISWIEALFVLPMHLAYLKDRRRTQTGEKIHQWQQNFSRNFSRLVERYYSPFIHLAVRHRYLSLSVCMVMLAIIVSYPMSGRMGFVLMPKVESDSATVTVQLPVGSPRPALERVRDQLTQAARAVVASHGGEQLSQGMAAVVEGNTIDMRVYLTPAGQRPISTAEFVQLWREAAGSITGVESLRFESDRGGPGRGAGITVELSHQNIAMLNQASLKLAQQLEEFNHVKDVDPGFSQGKVQFNFQLTQAARSAGLTAQEIARQVRSAFFGAEVQRLQRGRNEVKTLVRLPESERVHEYDIERLLLRLPDGGYMPLPQAVTMTRDRAYTQIHRREGRRTLTVSANVEPISESNRILSALKQEVLPQLIKDFPGLIYSFEGRQAAMRDALMSFVKNVGLALVVMYILLAIPFRSYVQPAVVMMAIPFGVGGAIIGHLVMGYSMSIISIMGVIALSGVVINDALVMIVYANSQRQSGIAALEAIVRAGERRFRPILLTTLTTFGGLAPMIFETSRQARFMIPMAISLGYGILFATAITLIVIPCLYMVIEDLRRGVGRETESELGVASD